MTRPVVLVILDGWGISKEKTGNSIEAAKLPNYRRFLAKYPHTVLNASGEAVGLPKGDVGNTEVGHLNLGAGRIVYQDLLRINLSIVDGTFFQNPAFLHAIEQVKKFDSALHIMGLIGEGVVHASKDHLFSLIRLCKEHQVKKLYLHLFTDGRDSPPTAAMFLLQTVEEYLVREEIGEIASICGRYYAMDRDNRAERTQKAFDLIAHGVGDRYHFAREAVEQQYLVNLTDEFFPPLSIVDDVGRPKATVRENDAVIFYNFRIDRARQLTKAFLNAQIPGLSFITMTEYEKNLPVTKIAFPPINVVNPLGFVLQSNNLRQLHVAETEKERFVTYYFNGLREAPFTGEERIIIPSPKVPTYDLKPEMSAFQTTDALVQKLATGGYDFAVINYANADMVGHTGIFDKSVTACEVIDQCLGKIEQQILSLGGTCIITADHGNVEEKIDLRTGGVKTEHTKNPVPCIIVNGSLGPKTLTSGILADVGPTILHLMGIPKPQEMTGKNLL